MVRLRTPLCTASVCDSASEEYSGIAVLPWSRLRSTPMGNRQGRVGACRHPPALLCVCSCWGRGPLVPWRCCPAGEASPLIEALLAPLRSRADTLPTPGGHGGGALRPQRFACWMQGTAHRWDARLCRAFCKTSPTQSLLQLPLFFILRTLSGAPFHSIPQLHAHVSPEWSQGIKITARRAFWLPLGQIAAELDACVIAHGMRSRCLALFRLCVRGAALASAHLGNTPPPHPSFLRFCRALLARLCPTSPDGPSLCPPAYGAPHFPAAQQPASTKAPHLTVAEQPASSTRGQRETAHESNGLTSAALELPIAGIPLTGPAHTPCPMGASICRCPGETTELLPSSSTS